MFTKIFSEKHLSPSERLSEILFGIIIILTVTSTLNIGLLPEESSMRIMAVAALATNFAWGIVDALMYLITSVFERTRHARLFQLAKSAGNKGKALEIILSDMDSTVLRELDYEKKRSLALEIVEKTANESFNPTRLSRSDLTGALSNFLIVFMSAIPIVIPFLVFQNLTWALRISNIIAFIMLFAVGFQMAVYVGKNRVQTGIAIALIGLAVVTVTIVLGG